jgi:Domain of unknown function (DUF4372)
MNIGKTLFARLMDFLPWSTFTRIVARYGGDARVRTLCCAEQYRAMAFAQLTYRESLRDIKVCLSAQAPKLYHMGFREPARRSTLGRSASASARKCASGHSRPFLFDFVCRSKWKWPGTNNARTSGVSGCSRVNPQRSGISLPASEGTESPSARRSREFSTASCRPDWARP